MRICKGLFFPFIFMCLFSVFGETIDVPVLMKIKTKNMLFRTKGAGFTHDKEKWIWGFEIDSLQELQKKENLSIGYYSDLDNDPKTGLPPWDFMFTVNLKQNKLAVLSMEKGKYRSYPLYPDDYVIKIQGNMLYIVLRKGCIRDKTFGKSFTMRVTTYHANSYRDKDGTLPQYWPDVKVNTEKSYGTFKPALKFHGFLSSKSRLQKERYCAKIGKVGTFPLWESFGEKFEEKESMPKVIAEKKSLQINGAKGEWEAVHFAVTAPGPLDSFRVIPGKLVNSSGKEFPLSALTVYYPSFATNVYGKVFTDPLFTTYKKSRSRNHFAVIDAHIPRELEKGVYKGKVRFEFNGKICKDEIPLEITVFDFALPAVRTLKTAMHVHPGYLGGGKEGYELMHKWGFSTQYPSVNGRINWGPVVKFSPGKITLDFERYSKACDEFFIRNKASTCVSVAFMRGSHDKYSRHWINRGCKDPARLSPEMKKYIAEAARQTEAFLKKKGLLEKFIFILWDEPYTSVYESIRETAAIIKKAAPGLRLGIYIGFVPESLAKDGNIDVWMLTFSQALEKAWKRGKASDSFWIYNDLGMGNLEAPGTLPRLYGHFAYLYSIEGYLCWCINMMRKQIEKQGARWLSSTSYTWYYPDPAGKKQVWPSLRLMMMREGMDDYEYFVLYGKKQGKNWKNVLKKHCELKKDTGLIQFKVKNNLFLQDFRNTIGRRLEQNK